MTTEQKIFEIKELLDDMTESELVYVHNEYCDDVCYYDDKIESYDNLDELCYGMRPTEIIENFGELSYGCWFTCGVYITEVDPFDTIDIDEIANYCVENDTDLYNNDIRNILNS